MTVSVSYRALERAAVTRPPGYLAAVLRAGQRRGGDIILSLDAYQAIREQFSHPQPGRRILPAGHPGLPRLVQGFGKEVVGWAKAGFGRASDEELGRRRAICAEVPCPHWDHSAYLGMGGCHLCGCSRAKLYLATASCPMGKW